MYGFRIHGTYANTNRRTQKARVQLVNDIPMLHHQNDQAKKRFCSLDEYPFLSLSLFSSTQRDSTPFFARSV